MAEWYLEGYVGGKNLTRTRLGAFPFRVGRSGGMDLRLQSSSVSGAHAEIRVDQNGLLVFDLGSRNGTFVNRKRIASEAALEDGDVIHFANCEFRLGRAIGADTQYHDRTSVMHLSSSMLPVEMAGHARELRELLQRRAVRPHFQPLVEIATGRTIGYEVLGRGALEGLTPLPLELFRIASAIGLEAELSELFRYEGVRVGQALPGSPNLFVNTHPAEMKGETLFLALDRLRYELPSQPITLEVHEAVVADPTQLAVLKTRLTTLQIGLAYDDFGAGQARLAELAEAPPDFLKFDMSLIRGIHNAPAHKQRMLEALVRMAHEMGVACLAEGVEVAAEHEMCAQLGFEHAQGYLYGKPAPLSAWTEE